MTTNETLQQQADTLLAAMTLEEKAVLSELRTQNASEDNECCDAVVSC